nr:MAG TPA: hypothetical protein [Caudoviricetes sp.]
MTSERNTNDRQAIRQPMVALSGNRNWAVWRR